MKVFLFYSDKIYSFILPKEIEGSYGFDADKNATTKLINIEARDGKWVIFSVDGIELFLDNQPITTSVLIDNTFYIVGKNGQRFLVYVADIESDKLFMYSYDQVNMIIGGTSGCNIKYDIPFLRNIRICIQKVDDGFILQQDNVGICYVNYENVYSKQTRLKYGDVVNIFSLKIIISNGVILLNNPGSLVTVDSSSGLVLNNNVLIERKNDIVINDRDLYDKNDYYSKSPRIRRVIEKKEINLSPPPNDNSNSDIPFIMTILPMLTMGLTSSLSAVQVFTRLGKGETTLAESWPQLAMTGGMLVSMLVWPVVMNLYNKRMKKNKRREAIFKYDKYLERKDRELQEEVHLQRDILIENLIPTSGCLNIINKKNVGFWDKRTDQNDFLVVRLGMGKQLLDVEIKYQEEDFSIDEDELREKADSLKERYKYITNVPVSYSFYENKISSIMGFEKKISFAFANNILLQLLTFYSYEDLKLVVFTNENNEKNWNYVKYLNHNFTNDRSFRFFSSDQESAKMVSSYLSNVLMTSQSKKLDKPDRPYYLIVVDDYDSIKRFDFIKELTELDDDDNYCFSMIIIEEKLNKLPSRCNNFISLTQSSGSILKNSFEKQEQIVFKDEIDYNIDMMSVAKIMSNIPIEFEDGVGSLPDSINFLEMYNVGKIEQLNILNRWNVNDSTVSLRAEIGVDVQGEPMYLDLHEKFHGPHGLIAGTTGSGKSEFIITYILSMCINYSPDDISFILIDYKGGGLALAFENRNSGIVLPHLAGTITNLDKAEMDRTLVSIDSEAKRRQALFNEARDITGESTMDIYKYQKLFKEGKLKEPVSHLFIICDEFAELKAQQPEFMDNLISIARIGRSLGVHLILATQKPSGVVNDQIWSNTRFRVCLKVQDESDSKEMLKKPDAAYITRVGRYYLQVGYDEVYAIGQSGYTGAKYFPSDKIIKQVDKSINFIDDTGQFIKSIKASGGPKLQSKEEQLQAILNYIIKISEKENKKSRRLWLENIPETILIDDLEKKYDFVKEDYHPMVILGEYDAPEEQMQGKVCYDFLKDGNCAVFGNDGAERELLLSSIIYSLCKNYSPSEVNIYTIDYGSESLRRFQRLPQVGGMVFSGDDEEYGNLMKMINEELTRRKKIMVDYGGEYKNYIKNCSDKLPLILVIINNFDSIKDYIPNAYDEYTSLVRDSERFGIVFIITADGSTSIHNKLLQNLPNIYSFKLKEQYDYISIFDKKTNLYPRDIFGRGLLDINGIHEFQVSKIVFEDIGINDFLQEFTKNQKEKYNMVAKNIPKLPDIVRYDDVKSAISDLSSVPIGISKYGLDVSCVDLLNSLGTIVMSNKLSNTLTFVKSLFMIFQKINNINLLIIDAKQELNIDFPNYYKDNLDVVTDRIMEYLENVKDSHVRIILLIYGIDKYIKKIEDKKINKLMSIAKGMENISVIIVDDYVKIKKYQFDEWFQNNFDVNSGLWIGQGVTEQNLIRLSSMNKEMMNLFKNDMGYLIIENRAILCRLIDFVSGEN